MPPKLGNGAAIVTLFRVQSGKAFEANGERAKAIEDYNKALTQANARQGLLRLQAVAPLPAAEKSAPAPLATSPVRRVALVIGNTAYTAVPALLNPKKDARDIAAALRAVGFAEVVERYDLTFAALRTALADFEDLAKTADWAVVYYAGHGIEMDGRNYLLPVDA